MPLHSCAAFFGLVFSGKWTEKGWRVAVPLACCCGASYLLHFFLERDIFYTYPLVKLSMGVHAVSYGSIVTFHKNYSDIDPL